MNGRNLTFRPSNPSSEFFINGTNGFVAVGKTTPTSMLDVNGVVKATNLFATNTSTSASTFTSSLEWYKKTNVFGAGFEMNDPTIAGSTRRMINFYDLFGWSPELTPNYDTAVFNIVDRDNKERLRFISRKGSSGSGILQFTLNDKNGAEIFKIIDDANENIGLQLAKPNSKVIIGGYLNYVPGLNHKLIVQNGSALIEGNIITNGSIGIGTENFTDGTDIYKLSVNGAMRASRVKVYTTWADYVFEKDYYLPTLEEVEKHIAEKGHLQDIPSAKQVEDNGIELGEMNKLLLQKIEELTLYIIEINKEVKVLQSQIKEN